MLKKPPVTALYVKLPAKAGDALDRAAESLGVAKKQIVTELVERYLGDGKPPTLGKYSFQAYDPPEVMSADQAAQFLQVDEALVVELAEAGKLPGRKLGKAWRFSREALVAWLAQPERK